MLEQIILNLLFVLSSQGGIYMKAGMLNVKTSIVSSLSDNQDDFTFAFLLSFFVFLLFCFILLFFFAFLSFCFLLFCFFAIFLFCFFTLLHFAFCIFAGRGACTRLARHLVVVAPVENSPHGLAPTCHL